MAPQTNPAASCPYNLSEFSTQEPLAAPASRAFSLPQIVLTECVSEPPSPEAEPELWVAPGSAAAGGQLPPQGTRTGHGAAPGSSPKSPPAPQPPGSASQEFPLASPPFPRDKTGGQGGDAALDSSEGSDKICPQISVVSQRPRSCGESAGAEGAGIIPQIPDTQKGARLAPGRFSGAPKAAWREESSEIPGRESRELPGCPVPHPGIAAGTEPAPLAPGHSREEQPLEQVPTWDGGAGTRGEVTEGFCKSHLSPGCATAPGKKEIYEDTYQRLDSLEETIRELEMTISEISSHPAVEFVLSKDPGSEQVGKNLGDLGYGDTALDLSQTKDGAPKSPVPSRTKPALLPKPQLPPRTHQVHFLFSPLALLCPGFALMSLPLPAPSL